MNNIKRLISVFVLAAMVCTCVLGGMNTTGRITKAKAKNKHMEKYLVDKVSKKNSKSGKIKKNETVYVELNSDGSVKKTTVSDVLDVKGNNPVLDVSNLDNITNLKGDERFTKTDDGKIEWENKGKSITYQGTTKENPPITISVSYSLDGKDISAEDLEGKSGEVQIQYKFKNNASVKKYDYVPFLVLGGFILDNETFKNVQIDNGRMTDYDESKIVLGYSMPGLRERLEKRLKNSEQYLDKIDLPDAFTITADVKDFSMNMGIIVATSSIGDFNIKDAIDLSDIKSKMDELQDGANQLVDGVGKLDTGAAKLGNASSKVKNGSKTLTSGLKKISKGSKKMYKGNKKFNKGLKKGLKAAKSGTKKLAKGSKKLVKGTKKVAKGAKKLKGGAKTLNSGVDQLADGISKVKTGFAKNGGLLEGSEKIKDGTKSANSGVNQLVTMLKETPDSIEEQINAIVQKVKQSTGGKISSAAQLKAVVTAINQAVQSGKPLDVVLESQGLTINAYYSLLNAFYGISTLESVEASIAKQISDHGKEINSLTKGMKQLEDGTKALDKGINQAYYGIYKLNEGATQLSNGSSQLKQGTSALSKGTKKIHKGAKQLSKGMNQLSNGTKTLASQVGLGSKKLLTASEKLKNAMETAYSGSDKLSNGIVPFCNGIDTLSNGTKQLKDGATKLNEKGIKKITTIFGDKAPEMINGIQDSLDAGAAYKSFSGISKDMDGQVKFIYKTAEIGIEE